MPTSSLLGSGSTLLNLQSSGRIEGAYFKGGCFHLVGASDSGKTMLTMSAFAEAASNPSFKKYRIIHDDPEGGALMDFNRFFGRKMSERIEEPPRGTSVWLEDFYYNLSELYKRKEPFIYVLDSMDSLDTENDEEVFDARMKSRNEGKDAPGSFGLAKAKMNSEGLRRAKFTLRSTGSILIVVSQERSKIGVTFGPKKTRGGGMALKFYSRLEIWTTPVKTLTKTVNKKPRQIGIVCEASVTKNHITGNKGKVQFPIYNTYGIDDLGSCVDFLVENGRWSKVTGGIRAPELKFKGSRASLIKMIEERDWQDRVRVFVGEMWAVIEESCRVDRKKRY